MHKRMKELLCINFELPDNLRNFVNARDLEIVSIHTYDDKFWVWYYEEN